MNTDKPGVNHDVKGLAKTHYCNEGVFVTVKYLLLSYIKNKNVFAEHSLINSFSLRLPGEGKHKVGNLYKVRTLMGWTLYYWFL